MTNPATRLAQLFAEWKAAPGTPPIAPRTPEDRHLEGKPELNFWRHQVYAVELISEVETALRTLEASGEEVSHYFEVLPNWYEGVFGHGHRLVQAAGGDGFNPVDAHDLRLLKSLGTTLNAAGYAREIPQAWEERLLDALDHAVDLVRDEDALSPGLKAYLLALIEETRLTVATVDRYGEVVPRTATFKLTGALQFAAMRSLGEPVEETNIPVNTQAKRERWATVINGLLLPFLAGTAGQITAGASMMFLGIGPPAP